jgi:hypothetical protein
VDAGHPLSDPQWKRLGKICAQPATCAHREPEVALETLQRQTLEALPKNHELAEFLQAMTQLLQSAEPEQMEQARLNLVSNLKGLVRERRDQLRLPLAKRAKVLRNLELMIRLHSVLASRGQMLKATPYHFS